MNKVYIPEWIEILSHIPNRSYKAMCKRCQCSYIGKLKQCNEWAHNHIELCEGAKCEKCGQVYDRYLWNRCPECGFQFLHTPRSGSNI